MRLPVSPFCWKPVASSRALVIEHHDVRRGWQISLRSRKEPGLRRDRAAVHAGPDAIRAAGVARDAVVELPEFRAARVVPQDPLAVSGIVPVGAARKSPGRSSGGTCAGTVVAVADAAAAQAGPTVVGETFRVGALDDLAQNVGQILVVVRAVDAGDVLVGGAVGLAVGDAREPVGMRLVEILARCGWSPCAPSPPARPRAPPRSVRRRDRAH